MPLNLSSHDLLEDPPDGVDLLALGPQGEKLLPPEECERLYENAFQQAGGEQALRGNAELASQLGKQIGHDRAVVTQMEAWQCYGLEFMMERMGDKTRVRKFGEGLIYRAFWDIKYGGPGFSPLVPEAEIAMGGVKKWERSSVKTRIKYGCDCSRLCDMNRCTIIFPDINRMYAATERLFTLWGPAAGCHSASVVEFEDHYRRPMPGGYRHLQLLLLIGGCVWELQLNTEPMIEAKHKAGHKLYKTTRFVKEMLLFTAMEGDVKGLDEILANEGVQEVADPNDVCDKNGLTALHHAAFRGDVEIINRLRDPSLVAEPADLWRLDKTRSGGLPLNYAVHMRHWEVTHVILDAMLQEVPPVGSIRIGIIEFVSNACFAGVDSFSEVPDLLPKLMQLWVALSPEEWERRTPLSYAFQHGDEPAQEVILRHVNLWAVDRDGRLPIENAVRYRFTGTAKYLVAPMLASKPVRPLAACASSLARCRGAQIEELDVLINSLKEWRLITSGTTPRTVLRQSNLFSLETLVDMEAECVYSCLVVSGENLYGGTNAGEIHVWSLAEREVQFVLEGHTQHVCDLVLGSKRRWHDGTTRVLRLFSCSADNSVRIWDLVTRQSVAVFKLKQDVTAMTLCGSTLYAAADRTVTLLNVNRREKLRDLKTGHGGIIESLITISKRIFSAGVGGEIRIWNHAEQGSPPIIWRGHTKGFRVRSLRRSSEDHLLSCANASSAALAYLSSREWRTRPRHDGPSEILHWSPEGEILQRWHDLPHCLVDIKCVMGMMFGASSRGAILVWNVVSGEKLDEVEVHTGDVASFAMGELDDESGDSDDGSAAGTPRSGEHMMRTVPRTLKAWTTHDRATMKKKFEEMDMNLDGRISLPELAELVTKGDKEITPLIETLFNRMDKDTDGTVSMDEFIDFIFT